MMSNIKKHRDKFTLLFVIIFTVCFHIACFYSLDGSTFTTSAYTNNAFAFLENDALFLTSNDTAPFDSSSVIDEELAELFKRISSQTTLPQRESRDQHSPIISHEDIQYDLNIVIDDSSDSTLAIADENAYQDLSLSPVNDMLDTPELSFISEPLTPPVFLSTDMSMTSEMMSETDRLLKENLSSDSLEEHNLDLLYVNDNEHAPLTTFDIIDDTIAEQMPMPPELFSYVQTLQTEKYFSSSSVDTVGYSVDTLPLLIPDDSDMRFTNDLNAVGTIASSDDFTIKVEYLPNDSGLFYFVRLTFLPEDDVIFKRINRNIFFLIDRSHSISKKRFDTSRTAVSKALTMLNKGDTFNILFFDDTVVKFADTNVPWTKNNVTAAQQFLSEQKHGGMFASTDLYSSLDKIIPEAVADNEVNIAILLSDGDTYLPIGKQRKTIGHWTNTNVGKVTLYSIASGRRNNLPLLNLLCSFNKGLLVYTHDDALIEKALINVMHSIHTPIGKDLFPTIVVPDNTTQVTLFPRTKRMPNLFKNTPYVMYGITNKLTDFHLFLQGRYYDKWLNIKKTISLSQAQQGSTDIARECLIHYAYDFYDKFLNDGDPKHLHKAKQILAPFHVDLAFR